MSLSSTRLRLTRSLAQSWAAWRQRRLTQQLEKGEQRLLLLQVETDRQLLLLKERQRQLMELQRQQQELAESQEWHRMQASSLVTLPTSSPTGPPRSRDSRSNRPTS